MKYAGVVGWVRRAAHMVFLGVISGLAPWPCLHAATVGLAWDDSTSDPTVAGYRVYYGAQSRVYTNIVDAGRTTSIAVSNLVPGVTYWFAATTYSVAGLESEYSTEVSYAVPLSPLNYPPTLDLPTDLSLQQDAGMQTIALTGISSGSPTEPQTLTLSAFSSNPGLIPNPTVNYTSPQTTGSLTFTPVAGSYGTNVITVMVDDGGAVSNTCIRTFKVVVNSLPATNSTPTLDPIPDLVVEQNSGAGTVSLTGITSGSPTENQTLVVTATSDNRGLIPDPAVSYTSPNSTGSLTFSPATNATGSAEIAVVVSDGQTLNSTISRLFRVTVKAITPPNLLTNTTISPNQLLKFVLNPPITNGHRFNFTLDSSAPSGAKVSVRKGTPYFVWTPTSAQASTTNLIAIHATDTVDPTVTTNEHLQVTVRDYLLVLAGQTSVEAGRKGSLPIAVTSSEGMTNLSFRLNWPNSRLRNPSLTVVSSNLATGSVQVQGANLLVSIQALPKHVLDGSNLVATVEFQTAAGQSSAFVAMPVTGVTAVKPGGSSYYNSLGQLGEIAMVGDVPLLKATVATPTRRDLILYGKVGTSYQLQYSTNNVTTGSGGWNSLLTYSQTNVSQTLTVDSAPPIIFYRLQQ